MARTKRLRQCEIVKASQPHPQSHDVAGHDYHDRHFEDGSISDQLTTTDDMIVVDHSGKKRKTRGPTRLPEVWNLPEEEQILVRANNECQPIDNGGRMLSQFCARIARNGQLCPLNFTSWHLMPKFFKTQVVKIVQTKFAIPPCLVSWVLMKVNRNWKDYKYELKATYFSEDISAEEIVENVPSDVIKDQWASLVTFFLSDEGKKRSKIGKEVHAKLKRPHTTGSKSYARKKEKMRKENGKEPSRWEFYKESHKHKDGSYVDDETTQEKGECMIAERVGSFESSESTRVIHDTVFLELMGKEHNGRVRGLGLGPTPTQHYGSHSGHNNNNEEVQKLQEELVVQASKVSELQAQVALFVSIIQQKFPAENIPNICVPSQPQSCIQVSDASHQPNDSSSVQHIGYARTSADCLFPNSCNRAHINNSQQDVSATFLWTV